jgi:hypothetical protein
MHEKIFLYTETLDMCPQNLSTLVNVVYKIDWFVPLVLCLNDVKMKILLAWDKTLRPQPINCRHFEGTWCQILQGSRSPNLRPRDAALCLWRTKFLSTGLWELQDSQKDINSIDGGQVHSSVCMFGLRKWSVTKYKAGCSKYFYDMFWNLSDEINFDSHRSTINILHDAQLNIHCFYEEQLAI